MVKVHRPKSSEKKLLNCLRNVRPVDKGLRSGCCMAHSLMNSTCRHVRAGQERERQESNKGLPGFTTYVITNDALIFFAKVFITKLFIVT